MVSLSEQLKMQQMYSQQIKDAKSERQLVEDELEKTKRKLKQVTKKTVVLSENAEVRS